mgnify:CR=1 FL=1
MWKELLYEGNNYLVSDTGDICRNGRQLHPCLNRDGYRFISMIKADGSFSGLRIGRAVAMAFIQNDDPSTKTEVNHKDYNRANDCVENLEWVSHADNVRHSVKNRVNISGENNPNYGNRKLSSWYAEHPEDALEKQSRKGVQNGKATRIKVFRDGMMLGDFEYITPCCEFLNAYFNTNCLINSLRGEISKAMRENRTYKGLTFEKL